MVERWLLGCAATLAAGCLVLDATADGFLLDDGERIDARLVQATRNTLILQPEVGGLRQLPRRRLNQVSLTTADGRVVTGALVAFADGRYRINVGDRVVTVADGRLVDEPPAAAAGTVPAAAGTVPAADVAGAEASERPATGRGNMAGALSTAAAQDEPSPGPAAVERSTVTLAVAKGATVEGAEELTFHLELSAPLDRPLVVIYATVDGSAKAGSDFQGREGILTIPGGARDAHLPVRLIDDDQPETAEQFQLFLGTNAELATLTEPWIEATIEDDD